MAVHTSLKSLFTDIADVLRAKLGMEGLIVADTFPSVVAMLPPRLIMNDEDVVPTGTYATEVYYNAEYGVKVGYCPNGEILVSMKSGTTTAYENIFFALASAPAGVTITTDNSNYDTGDLAGNLYVCVLAGVAVPVEMSIAMNTINATDDFVQCDITLTAV